MLQWGTVPTILLSEVDDKLNRLSGSSFLALVCSKLFYFVLKHTVLAFKRLVHLKIQVFLV
jgi:hypothetical protein